MTNKSTYQNENQIAGDKLTTLIIPNGINQAWEALFKENFSSFRQGSPEICASVSRWSLRRWCVGGLQSPSWLAPTPPCPAPASLATSEPSPPSSSSVGSPRSDGAWLRALNHPRPLSGRGRRFITDKAETRRLHRGSVSPWVRVPSGPWGPETALPPQGFHSNMAALKALTDECFCNQDVKVKSVLQKCNLRVIRVLNSYCL